VDELGGNEDEPDRKRPFEHTVTGEGSPRHQFALGSTMRFCRRSGLGWRWLDRNRTKLQASVQRCSDPAYHRQCMTLVIGILKATNHRGCRPNTLGELSLRETRLRSHVVDQLSRFNVDEFLFKVGLSLSVVADDLLIGYLERFRLKSFLGSHDH
jgi:hypothetical protein